MGKPKSIHIVDIGINGFLNMFVRFVNNLTAKECVVCFVVVLQLQSKINKVLFQL